MSPQPLVWIVMPTTRSRAAYLPRALANWQRQTYGNFRVLVLDSSDGGSPSAVRDVIPNDPRFLYGCVPPMPLGEKYNAGCHMAPDGALLAFAGDDDWNHPDRLTDSIAAMEAAKVEIAGSMSILAYRERDKTAFWYSHPCVAQLVADEEGDDADTVSMEHTTPYLIHGTMIVAKHYWERCQMPSLQRASDSVWTRDMLALGTPEGEPITIEARIGAGGIARVTVKRDEREISFLQFDAPRSYVAWGHSGNTGSSLDSDQHGAFWRPWEGGVPGLVALLGPDAAAFGLNELSAPTP